MVSAIILPINARERGGTLIIERYCNKSMLNNRENIASE
jgi:hypothetical protein